MIYIPTFILGIFMIVHADTTKVINPIQTINWSFLNLKPSERVLAMEQSLKSLSGSILNGWEKNNIQVLKEISKTLLNPDFQLSALSGSIFSTVSPQVNRIKNLKVNILDFQWNTIAKIDDSNRNNFFSISYLKNNISFDYNPNLHDFLVDSLQKNIPSWVIKNSYGQYAYSSIPFDTDNNVDKIISFISTASWSVTYNIPSSIIFTPKESFTDRIWYTSISFKDSDTWSQSNIAESLSYLNGIILKPGEKLDYNAIMQPKTKDFTSWHWILNGKIVNMDAWWICGTATVLYNAALYAGLDIIKHSPHSVYHVASYGSGLIWLDSAVYFGSENLIIKNTTSSSIFIHTEFNPKTALASVILFWKKKYDSIKLDWPYQDNIIWSWSNLIWQKNTTFHWLRTFTKNQKIVQSERIVANYRDIQ